MRQCVKMVRRFLETLFTRKITIRAGIPVGCPLYRVESKYFNDTAVVHKDFKWTVLRLAGFAWWCGVKLDIISSFRLVVKALLAYICVLYSNEKIAAANGEKLFDKYNGFAGRTLSVLVRVSLVLRVWKVTLSV